MSGPLSGIRVVEFAGLGPAPFAAMLLADMGAEVLRIDRPDLPPDPRDVGLRGRLSLALDLKDPAAIATCKALADSADVLIEGFRPGVMERLGLGPDTLLAGNPRLVYGRVTGWGQDGPLAQAAGHDINYIALTGALAAIGGADGPPLPPLNLVGDFGGGALYLALGVVSALFERSRSGQGQVIDAAIVDGTASLMNFFMGVVPQGITTMDRKDSLLAGQAPFYGCYACADGLFIAIGPIEPHFHARLLRLLEIDPANFPPQYERARWPEARALLEQAFVRRSRAAWCALLEGTDACFAPVLTLDEAPSHPHMMARGVYRERDGRVEAQPAPRFSRTPGAAGDAVCGDSDAVAALLERWGMGL
ncbi:CaiB/BaiF CoA transferase family protein [Novosphingobium colocasiae]|uniref:Alpha-methylacyl-CoA racemase n=1 Tax=Novosphingobium colocasiae TaxID=1256513 RepID=A0A918UD35_9SPHN|nr:CaiB/BaiF CoA-transferase family protein [Novosphingobium colocasiae]GGY90641.1 alpha-methylacyl-CoA racemase [Novosphingobium colocasiae]